MITIMSNWREIFEDGAEISLPLSAILFRREDRVRRIFLIVTGSVKLERGLADGAPLVLKQAAAGALLAEASLFAERYHCDAIASEASLLFDAPRKGQWVDVAEAIGVTPPALYRELARRRTIT